MDQEQAKFILQSFRPDGADANDADFTEALQLAASDRELGDWLARERAEDAAFAQMLGQVEIPERLRQHIMSVMRGESPREESANFVFDEDLTNALAGIEPPEGLREQILTAVEAQERVITPQFNQDVNKSDGPKHRFRWPQIAAVAAALALGAFLAIQLTQKPSGEKALVSHDVHIQAAKVLDSGGMSLDMKNSNVVEVNRWLSEHELPTPTSLPRGLRDMTMLGCKMIKLPGDTKASMVCFTKDSGNVLHLVIVPSKILAKENLPTMDKLKKSDCYFCPDSRWNVARWRDTQNTFILLAHKNAPNKKDMLEYF